MPETIPNSQYWVVKGYGSRAIIADMTFTLNDQLNTADQENPSNSSLCNRSSTSRVHADFAATQKKIHLNLQDLRDLRANKSPLPHRISLHLPIQLFVGQEIESNLFHIPVGNLVGYGGHFTFKGEGKDAEIVGKDAVFITVGEGTQVPE